MTTRSWLVATFVAVLAGCGGSGPGAGVDGGTVDADQATCVPKTCAELGWACGYMVTCDKVHDCADEGLTCDPGLSCVGGVTGPTQCVTGLECPLCSAIPNCTGQPQTTKLTGRVITAGRDDGDVGNQVGVPNALVYILRDDKVADLPTLPAGLPAGGTSCDRCEDQAPLLGPVLSGAVSDATGHFTIEGDIPVGVDFLLVVKAGKFRRAVVVNLPADAACTTTTLPEAMPANQTHLPRTVSDGLAVNFPRIAVTTGRIDAMECVLEKIGIDHGEFGNFGGAAHVELYRGADPASPAGARIDDATPHSEALYGDLGRLEAYDLVVADCEGTDWDASFAERDAHGALLRSYLNRGGRLFASHLSFSWLYDNGATPYAAATAASTGLASAATWQTTANATVSNGTAVVAKGRPNASPRIDQFADWLVNEGVTTGPAYQFPITDPRSQVTGLGSAAQEYVYCDGADCVGDQIRTQQFSFNTPVGAPAAAACGRVAYSGFHVTAGNFADSVFPAGCSGDLTDQEKVLLYMLFDLSSCVGNPLPPTCVPLTCDADSCGFSPDGCGGIRDCGPCGGVP